MTLLSSVGLLASVVLIFSTLTEARPSQGILSLPKDAWTATNTVVNKGKHAVVTVVKDVIPEVSGAWVIGVTCAVSSYPFF